MERVLFDFADPGAIGRWEAVNDAVMGGLSRGRIHATSEKTALFEGEVSLENYGGFASVRTLPGDYGLEGFAGLSLRVRGDGRRYRLRLKTDDYFDGAAYQAGFDTVSGRWVEIRLPFGEFLPVFRGRIVSDAPPLEPGRIRRVGFMIADHQEGPFRIEIAWVKAYGH
jgi:hypothetical protein